MEEIIQPLAIAGTVVKKKTYVQDETSLNKIIGYIKSCEMSPTSRDVEIATGLPMYEVSMCIIHLIKVKKLRKGNLSGGRPTFCIFIPTEDDLKEISILPLDTRGPSNRKTSIKNYTKYLFEDNSYGKGKLVLALVKSFVSNNPDMQVVDIQKVFPKRLHSKFNVVEVIKDAADKTDKQRRFFLDANQIIKLKDGTVLAVCSQWGSNNIDNVINHCVELLNYQITGSNK